jgi:hypothetical protein
LVYFSPFWYFGPINIWQPWSRLCGIKEGRKWRQRVNLLKMYFVLY